MTNTHQSKKFKTWQGVTALLMIGALWNAAFVLAFLFGMTSIIYYLRGKLIKRADIR